MLTLKSMVTAVKGREYELEKELLNFAKKVKKEEGVVVYNLHRVQDQKGRFFFYEQFEDEKSFEIHNSTDHMNQLKTIIADLIESPPELVVLDKIFTLNKS